MPDAACMAFQLIALVDVIRALVSTTEHALNATMGTPAIAVGAHSKDQSALTVRTCFYILLKLSLSILNNANFF